MALPVRLMSAEETQTIEQLSRSRTAERARIIRLTRQGLKVPAIPRELGVHE